MRKTMLVYGGIAGLLMDLMFVISFDLMERGVLTFGTSEVFGYATMIVVLSLIFFGVKSYRDRHSRGAITFGRAFRVGLSIAAVASVMYAAGWEVYYNTAPGLRDTFMQRYTELTVKKMEHDGKTKEEIDRKRVEMTSLAGLYQNPFIRFGMTLAEIVPVGLIIALVSAGVLRRKGVLPAETA